MKKGFTLIELAMVMIVVGLLMGGAFQMMKVMQTKARATEAKQTLQSAKEAIMAFAINHNRLPTQADFAAMQLIGVGNINMFYNSDAPLQTNLCDATSTLSTIDPNGVTTPNIGFVLAVAGENFNVQTGRIGNSITFHPWNTAIDDNPNPLDRPEPYDDLYVQVTLDELQSVADCQTHRFKIINTTLPLGTVNASYTLNPTVVTTGGTPLCSAIPTPCSYTVSGLLGSGLSFSAATNTISGTPTTANNYPLTFTAANGTASDSKSLLLVISEPAGTGTGTGTSAHQQCIDACDAGSGSAQSIAVCKSHCP